MLVVDKSWAVVSIFLFNFIGILVFKYQAVNNNIFSSFVPNNIIISMLYNDFDWESFPHCPTLAESINIFSEKYSLDLTFVIKNILKFLKDTLNFYNDILEYSFRKFVNMHSIFSM